MNGPVFLPATLSLRHPSSAPPTAALYPFERISNLYIQIQFFLKTHTHPLRDPPNLSRSPQSAPPLSRLHPHNPSLPGLRNPHPFPPRAPPFPPPRTPPFPPPRTRGFLIFDKIFQKNPAKNLDY